jgi:hypothetical protein
MNERYEQLFAQAHIEFAPDSKAVTKKFAELIVRECLDVVAGHCGGDPNSEPVKIFLDIEKHFGVE